MDQVAVILPGAGSSSEFVIRTFAEPLREAGYALVAPSPVPGPGLVAAAYAALDAAASTYGPRLRLVGGISLGAHIAARWAARAAAPAEDAPAVSAAPPPGGDGWRGVGAVPAAAGRGPWGVELAGVVLVLPAWTGVPGAVAAATLAAADSVQRLGTAGALAAAGDAIGWIAAELAAAWPGYGPQLAASLRAAAAAPGPTLAELAALPVPAGLVAFADDPLHPAAVAREWAATAPYAALRVLPVASVAEDRTVLGRAALAALRTATPR